MSLQDRVTNILLRPQEEWTVIAGERSRMSELYLSYVALLAGGFRLIPALDFLVLLGFYSLYLLYLGAPVLMRVPQQNVVGYAATVIVAAAAIFFVISVIGGWFLP